jgi:hypothetical protein
MSGRFCSKNNTSLLFEQNRPDIRAYFIVFRRYFLWSSNRVVNQNRNLSDAPQQIAIMIGKIHYLLVISRNRF